MTTRSGKNIQLECFVRDLKDYNGNAVSFVILFLFSMVYIPVIIIFLNMAIQLKILLVNISIMFISFKTIVNRKYNEYEERILNKPRDIGKILECIAKLHS